MNEENRKLWELKAAVKPKLECDKVGVANFELGEGEIITFREHRENETTFSVVVRAGSLEVQDRAEFLMKAFVAIFSLESRRQFTFKVGAAHPM
jgi:hypothetical protein